MTEEVKIETVDDAIANATVCSQGNSKGEFDLPMPPDADSTDRLTIAVMGVGIALGDTKFEELMENADEVLFDVHVRSGQSVIHAKVQIEKDRAVGQCQLTTDNDPLVIEKHWEDLTSKFW